MLGGRPADGGDVRPGDRSACCGMAGELESWNQTHSDLTGSFLWKGVASVDNHVALGTTKITSRADETQGGWGYAITG